jgi:CDP-2,3-bis-(O-geranylgeranyl)-sn-glycerol synthase
MDVLLVIPRAFWLLLPMLTPNSIAVLVGGGTPIDFGRKMKDGNRIFGDGKTWRGLIGGILLSMGLGVLQWRLAWELGEPEWSWTEGFYPTLLIIFIMALGAMLGDLTGSYIKRRKKKDQGAKFPVLDQYDFFIMAVLLLLILQFDWFVANFIEDEYLIGFIGIIIVIPLLHRGLNIIGYKLGKKDVPW